MRARRGQESGYAVYQLRWRAGYLVGLGAASVATAGYSSLRCLEQRYNTATITHRKPICEATLAHKMLTIFSNRTYLRADGLMSYWPDLEGVFQRAAYFVDRILKGAKPIDLPIEQATTFQLVLNQRTARALGLRFPQSLLIGAGEVIE